MYLSHDVRGCLRGEKLQIAHGSHQSKSLGCSPWSFLGPQWTVGEVQPPQMQHDTQRS